ncbi:hypothetical protein Tco_0748163 [Tanacetum coccineum]|uniref:Uncharacterized protein n=1 Tax=Tanacetum coccineum TaxID=301880 RepID=A0ABQ4YXK2_9ASTR
MMMAAAAVVGGVEVAAGEGGEKRRVVASEYEDRVDREIGIPFGLGRKSPPKKFFGGGSGGGTREVGWLAGDKIWGSRASGALFLVILRIMNTTKEEQKELDDALEPTLQVVLDALKLTPFYNAFEISADVTEIYMQELWVTVTRHHSSLRFKLDGKSHTVNVDNFRDMLKICPKLPGQKFEEPPLEEDILSFIRDLGHTGEIKFLSDVNVNHMHQPWRSFASIINKCLSGKTTALENLVFQVENKNSKKNYDMYYPRFAKFIVDYFMAKDQAIPRRKKMFWHYARDDFMFTTIRVISKHKDTQEYGVILPQHFTNQAMLEFEAFKTYHAYATGEKAPKSKATKKNTDSKSYPKTKPSQASKGKRIKTSAKGDKPATTKLKGLTVLSEAVLSEAEQMKLATKRSMKEFHISHANGSGDGVDLQSKVPDEQQHTLSGTNEGFGNKPEVPDVPEYSSESEEESWMFSQGDDDEEDEEHNSDDDNDDNDDEDDDQENDNQNQEDEDYVMGGEQEDEEDEELVSSLEIELSELKQTNQFAEAVASILGIVDNYLTSKMKYEVNVDLQLKSNKLIEEAQADNQDLLNSIDSNMKKIIKEQVKAPTSKIMSKVKKYITKTLGAEVLVRSTNQPSKSYADASSLSELELKKILMDKMEENKSIDRSEVQMNLYNALVKAYNSDNDFLSAYGDVVTISRGHDDEDNDEEPSAGSNRGTKRRRLGKEAESSKEPTHKESRTTSTSKRPSRSQQTDLEDPIHQEFITGDDDVSPVREVSNMDERLWNPIGSQTPDRKWNKTKTVDNRPPQPWMSQLAQASGTTSSFNKFLATPIDFFAFIINRLNIQNLTQDLLTGLTYDLIKGTCKSVVELEYHLGEGKLTNLNVDERFTLNVALRMYTRRIVIQERVEDLQPAVESYQKKINLTKPDTYRTDLRKMTPYTVYRDIQIIIYQDDMDRNHLMRTDELHKFSDGTLNHVRTSLNDIATGIQMEYLQKRKWIKQDKQRDRVMIKAIDKKLKYRRLMRSLEKFVGGRPYRGDLQLLQRTI